MKHHLKTLALILMLDKCKELGIDPSGTEIVKEAFGQSYVLFKLKTADPIISIKFNKSARPSYLTFDK